MEFFSFNGVTYIPDVIWSELDFHMSTDVCLSRAGGLSNGSYFSESFPKLIKEEKFHINILDMLAILVGLLI